MTAFQYTGVLYFLARGQAVVRSFECIAADSPYSSATNNSRARELLTCCCRWLLLPSPSLLLSFLPDGGARETRMQQQQQQQTQTPRQSSTTSLPFAGVTPELALRLEAEAEGLVQHHVRAYEAHVYQLRREELRDPELWRRVQSSKHGSFSVYRRMRVRRKPSTATPSSSGSSSSTRSSKDALPTQLLGVGFTVGTVEDMLFGSSALSTAAIKIQSLYAQDPIVDAAVLATLLAPSAGDPLRSVTLKWVMKKPKMYGVTRHRDYVFIESIGIRRSSVCGERIGYHLMHSIDLPSFPVLDDESEVVRRRLSCCYLYRSIGSGLIECFLRASTDPGRRTPEALVVRATANRLLCCCPGFMRVAETNKLIFALQQDALMNPENSRPPRR